MNRSVIAVDVGSVRSGAFAWARIGPVGDCLTGSSDVDALVETLIEDLHQGLSVALGFECPLFMPIPESSSDLNRGRESEGNRSMFAPAGAAVTTIGLHQAAWVLAKLRDGLRQFPRYTIASDDWMTRAPADQVLFIWEAFVSGKAHADAGRKDSHLRDAATAARYFAANESQLSTVSTVSTPFALNTAHVAALWSGWATDLDRLRDQMVVLRPDVKYRGTIGRQSAKTA